MSGTISCIDCGAVVPRRGETQKRCRECARKMAAKRCAAWRKTHREEANAYQREKRRLKALVGPHGYTGLVPRMTGLASHTLDETAAWLGISCQLVQQIEAGALRKLRKALSERYNINSFAEAIG